MNPAQTSESPPPDRQPTTRVLAMPTDTNAAGDIFGGWIMSQVDIAGSVVAHRRASGRVVTVAVNSFQFHRPVYVADLISCYAEVVQVGTTSLTVHVELTAFARTCAALYPDGRTAQGRRRFPDPDR